MDRGGGTKSAQRVVVVEACRPVGVAALILLGSCASCPRSPTAGETARPPVALSQSTPPGPSPATVETSAECPGSPPIVGTSCSTPSTCSWGAHPAIVCRSRGVCEMGRWNVTPTPASCAMNPLACADAQANGACPAGAIQCAFPDGRACVCTVCCNSPGCRFSCGGKPHGSLLWKCDEPPMLKPPCAGRLPNDGAPCSLQPGAVCLEATCGLNVTCDGRSWRWRLIGTSCPGSNVRSGRLPGKKALTTQPIGRLK